MSVANKNRRARRTRPYLPVPQDTVSQAIFHAACTEFRELVPYRNSLEIPNNVRLEVWQDVVRLGRQVVGYSRHARFLGAIRELTTGKVDAGSLLTELHRAKDAEWRFTMLDILHRTFPELAGSDGCSGYGYDSLIEDLTPPGALSNEKLKEIDERFSGMGTYLLLSPSFLHIKIPATGLLQALWSQAGAGVLDR